MFSSSSIVMMDVNIIENPLMLLPLIFCLPLVSMFPLDIVYAFKILGKSLTVED